VLHILHAVAACRHADGTISSSGVADVWRMASEDSDQVLPGLSVVHRVGDLRDTHKPVRVEVLTARDDLHAGGELQEVLLLGRSERILHEERND
jgi:hypothetical protein